MPSCGLFTRSGFASAQGIPTGGDPQEVKKTEKRWEGRYEVKIWLRSLIRFHSSVIASDQHSCGITEGSSFTPFLGSIPGMLSFKVNIVDCIACT